MRVDCPNRYGVVSALTNSQTDRTFGPLWQGDAARAKKDVDRCFGKEKLKLRVIVEENDNYSSDDNEIEEVERFLSASLVRVHGKDVYSLMDTRATPSVLSPRLVRRLCRKTEKTNKSVTAANETRSGVSKVVTGLPVMLEDLQAKIDFVVLVNVRFDIVIRTSTLRRLGEDLGLKKR